MNYTHQILESLIEYNEIAYKAIGVKVSLISSKFEHRALPYILTITNDSEEVNAFRCFLSGNQKEIISYFTVDAFTNFTNNASIQIRYLENDIFTIENVDIQNIPPLPDFLSGVPYSIADNAWLQSITT